MVIAFGLGSNLGNRLANLREAAARLESALGPLVGKSDVFETEPWGVRDQPWYLNACVSLEPEREIAPLELLSLVKGMERSLGRVEGERWRARKIDIDILLMGGTTFHSLELEIPHVRLDERLFVLAPLCQIAPSWVHPVLRLPVAELEARQKLLSSSSALNRIVRL